LATLQLVKDFVDDCKNQIAGYFFDLSHDESAVADRLAEDVAHHATVLGRCNASNAALRPRRYSTSGDQLPPATASPASMTGLVDNPRGHFEGERV